MKVYRSLEEYEQGTNTAATIGTFDGVHEGHKKILNSVIEAARAIDGESVVISFHPHPRLVLYPEDNPLRLLHTIDERIAALEALGIDKLMLVPFTREFSRLTSHQFIENILVRTIGISKIVIGYDHHFGKGRTGGIKDLTASGREHGYTVQEIPAAQIDNANVSSTKIRNALLKGDVATAARFMGAPYPLSGTVIKGEQLGRQLGFPTANIRPEDPYKLIPAEGVYLADLTVDGATHHGMLNIGRKPSVGDFPLGIEINLFDFDRDIYGKHVELRFLEWIRADKKFDGLDALKAAIAEDERACRALLGKNVESRK